MRKSLECVDGKLLPGGVLHLLNIFVMSSDIWHIAQFYVLYVYQIYFLDWMNMMVSQPYKGLGLVGQQSHNRNQTHT